MGLLKNKILVLIMIWPSYDLLALPPVKRADTTLGHVLHACESALESEYADAYCVGFIEGVFNTVESWCVPASITHNELRYSIIAKLKTVDSTSSFPFPSAAEEIQSAIEDLYPCDSMN